MKTREDKSRQVKERYKHLNTEFKKIKRREKKAFLSDQCKERGEKMGKNRDLFKKNRDTKGTFNAKIGSIQDRNDMDLTKAEDVMRSGKKTQENCTKISL